MATLLEGEQAVCTSSSVEDMPTALAGCKDGPHEQPRLIDIKCDNHRCGKSMDMTADEADTPSMLDNTQMISNKLEEMAVEGSLGVEATDIAASMETMTQTTNLNQEGGDMKVCYQILRPKNAGVVGCVKAQPAGAYSQPEHGQPNKSPVWNVPEAANALLEGEQNGCGSLRPAQSANERPDGPRKQPEIMKMLETHQGNDQWYLMVPKQF
ncbi:hypothetical protein BKA83DRAFT_4125578 [Pisolithus microcarpus]|nr:hypothetical protein BKA83DRAFT_4125578 [Pisolithus microcarpus]